jgi:hypothetical protein
MAYTGPISYPEIPYGKVKWLRNIKSASIRGSVEPQGDETEVQRKHRVFNPTDPVLEARITQLLGPCAVGTLLDASAGELIVLDRQDDTSQQPRRPIEGVVIGELESDAAEETQMHWLLLVRPKGAADRPNSYKRVGFAALQKRRIDFGRGEKRDGEIWCRIQ